MKDKKPYDWHDCPNTRNAQFWESVLAFIICMLVAFGVPAP